MAAEGLVEEMIANSGTGYSDVPILPLLDQNLATKQTCNPMISEIPG